ncbi:MAG: MBL fold metallo-hydrolase [Firmicutes bacterium]|nr:MBL fold metallo-hydrolase [Bacillota bacterium]
MEILGLAVGPTGANCYIITHNGSGIIIDPGAEGERILQILDERKLKIEAVINTHGHFDHIGANADIKKATDAPLYIHETDAPMLPDPNNNLAVWAGVTDISSPPADKLLQGGEVLPFAGLEATILHTPGHTPGCICIKIGDALFSGDTLFAGSVGRTDLPGSSETALYKSINEVILPLPKHTAIYPGHGPASTLGRERRENPFLL